jgi:hypothetical protein
LSKKCYTDNVYDVSKIDRNSQREIISMVKMKTRCYYCNITINTNHKIIKSNKIRWVCESCKGEYGS